MLSFVGCDKTDSPSSTIDTSSDIGSSNSSTDLESTPSSENESSSNVNSDYMNNLGALKPMDPDFSQDDSAHQDTPSRYDPNYNSNHISGNYNSSENSSSSNSKPNNYQGDNDYNDYQSPEDNSGSSDGQNSNSNIQHSSYIPSNYNYVWGDEFEGTSLNKNLWSDQYTKMTGRNVLSCESSPKTISVKDGALLLRAYKDKSGVYHVPTSVHTQGTMNYKYGYMEMRAKLSLEVGSFASFWTRSIGDNPKLALTSTDLKQFGEVDMFEVFQYGGKQYIGGNILKNSDISELNWYATPMPWTQKHIVPDEDYHIYGYEWTPTEIKLYFDGEVYARFDMSKSWTGDSTEGMGLPGWNRDVSNFKDKTGTGMECFNDPQYLILNHHLHIAVDDGNGGTTGFLASTSVTENKDFENADYLIDYIRLYQQDGQELYTK